MGKPHIIINIPKPCHEDWDKMTPEMHGRFCGSCSKSVIDFSTWSDAQLYNFFASNNERICGRFMATQVGRQIHFPPQPHSRLYRIAVALGLTLLFVQGSDLKAQTKVPMVVQTVADSVKVNDSITHIDSVSITGTVTDMKKEPIINASVRLTQNGKLVGGAITDFDGKYRFTKLDAGLYDITFSYIGMKTQTITAVVTIPSEITELNVILANDGKQLMEMGVIYYCPKPMSDKYVPDKTTIRRDRLKNLGY